MVIFLIIHFKFTVNFSFLHKLNNNKVELF